MSFFPKHLSKLEISNIVATFLSAILGIITIICALWPDIAKDVLSLFFTIQNAVLIVALALLVGYFIRVAEIRANQLNDWEINRYEIPKSIHGFIHETRNFFSQEEDHRYSPQYSYTELQMACNCCKDIFDRLTKVENTVTIKMIVDDGTNFMTVARDQAGAAVCARGI